MKEKRTTRYRKPPRKQHIQPRAYLARFEDPSGCLWVYEALKEPRSSSAKREATQRDYFEVKLPGEETNYAMEQQLSRLETLAEPAISKLSRGNSLDREELAAWSLYVASIFLRSRKVRDHLIPVVMSGSRDTLVSEAKLRDNQWNWYRRSGVLLPLDHIRRVAHKVADKFDDAAFLHNQALRHNTSSIAYKLAEKDWYIAEPTPGMTFVTSDAPAFSYKLENDLLYPGYGWGRNDSFVALPITPNKMFVAVPRDHTAPSQYDEVSTETLNRAIIAFADRFVYADKKHEQTRELANRLIGQVRFGIDAYVATNTSVA